MSPREFWVGLPIFILCLLGIIIGWFAALTLCLVMCGPAMLIAGPLMIVCLLVEGHSEPWKATSACIRIPCVPYLWCHWAFCKVIRLEQRV